LVRKELAASGVARLIFRLAKFWFGLRRWGGLAQMMESEGTSASRARFTRWSRQLGSKSELQGTKHKITGKEGFLIWAEVETSLRMSDKGDVGGICGL
jgi:hypothetical protein